MKVVCISASICGVTNCSHNIPHNPINGCGKRKAVYCILKWKCVPVKEK